MMASSVPNDDVFKSADYGKAAARRRRAEFD
jgi:hypothetical protein